MINLVFIASLAAGGVISALWREYRQKNQIKKNTTNVLDYKVQSSQNLSFIAVDDVTEISHHKRVSVTSLVLSSVGTLFYFPYLIFASLPLISYNVYFLLKIIYRNRQEKGAFSLIVLYEMASLSLILLTRHFVLASFSLFISFVFRQLLLQAGNVKQLNQTDFQNKRLHKIWVLRQNIEIETPLSNLKKGDIVVVRAEEIIMFNGTVVHGKATVQQYSLTGKSKHVKKQAGATIFAFTRLKEGLLHIRY